MSHLVDTNVLSELRKPRPDVRVVAWFNSAAAQDMYTSVVTIGEIVRGIALLPSGGKQASLQSWVESLERDFDDRILPIDVEVARVWGRITAAARNQGRQASVNDALIAATAVRHNLTVVTRNRDHIEGFGAAAFNPWE